MQDLEIFIFWGARVAQWVR